MIQSLTCNICGCFCESKTIGQLQVESFVDCTLRKHEKFATCASIAVAHFVVTLPVSTSIESVTLLVVLKQLHHKIV